VVIGGETIFQNWTIILGEDAGTRILWNCRFGELYLDDENGNVILVVVQSLRWKIISEKIIWARLLELPNIRDRYYDKQCGTKMTEIFSQRRPMKNLRQGWTLWWSQVRGIDYTFFSGVNDDRRIVVCSGVLYLSSIQILEFQLWKSRKNPGMRAMSVANREPTRSDLTDNPSRTTIPKPRAIE